MSAPRKVVALLLLLACSGCAQRDVDRDRITFQGDTMFVPPSRARFVIRATTAGMVAMLDTTGAPVESISFEFDSTLGRMRPDSIMVAFPQDTTRAFRLSDWPGIGRRK